MTWFTGKRLLGIIIVVLVVLGIVFGFFVKSHKQEFAVGSLNLFTKVSKLLPLAPDTKAELEAVDSISQALLKKDSVTRSYLVLLQNNYELRPGGGFLGQYAIVKIQDGQVVSNYVEDANLLDQRIKNANIKVTPPWPLTRYSQIKRWSFRDSNFSPDFPTNADKAQYFYRLAGGGQKFDGVIAVNALVFDHLLELTGPIQIPGSSQTFSAEDGSLKLEEVVEKSYLGDDVPAELKQARKNIMKNIAGVMVNKLATVDNIPKVIQLGLEELREKNIMLHFNDPTLQAEVVKAKWDGSVDTAWDGDYLMLVDANLGALKSDYYVKRSLQYTVDFTGEKPTATVRYTYNHTATHGDWRTSDYHTYARILAPAGSTYVEESRLKTGGVQSAQDPTLKKTIFGYKVDALIGQSLETGISYTLPDSVKAENYKLMLQKQSGVGTIPVTITLKTKEGEQTEHADLKKDLVFTFQTVEEKK